MLETWGAGHIALGSIQLAPSVYMVWEHSSWKGAAYIYDKSSHLS